MTFAWKDWRCGRSSRWSRGGRLSLVGACLIGLGWLVRPELGVVQRRLPRVGPRGTVVAGPLVRPCPPRRGRSGDPARLPDLPDGLLRSHRREHRDPRGRHSLPLRPGMGLLRRLSCARTGSGSRCSSSRSVPTDRWSSACGAFVRVAANAVVVAFVACAAADVLYVVAVGGDYIHARLLLPGVFAFCAARCGPAGDPPLRRRARLTPWVIVCARCRPPHTSLGDPIVMPVTPGKVTTNDFGWGSGTCALPVRGTRVRASRRAAPVGAQRCTSRSATRAWACTCRSPPSVRSVVSATRWVPISTSSICTASPIRWGRTS